MKKEDIYLDLSKCTEDQLNHILSLLPAQTELTQYVVAGPFTDLHFKYKRWVTDIITDGKTEITYPEFIKLFEDGDGEDNEDLLIKFLEFHYRNNPFRNHASNINDVREFLNSK